MRKITTYSLLLMLSMVFLTSCDNNEDHYIAEQLIGRDWQGYLGAYYYDRWSLSGSEFWTVMRFTSHDSYATSGRGYEVDYRTNSWREDYAYCTFKWFIVDGEITLIYDDNVWKPIYIYNYRLSDEYFDGYIDDGSRRDIRFQLDNVDFAYWDSYRRGTYWNTRSVLGNDFASGSETIVKHFDDNGMSIRSGVFAK